MKRKILILIGIIVLIVVIIIGINIYRGEKESKSKESVQAINTQVNKNTSIEKPKVLTQKELALKEKRAAENWKIRMAKEKKPVSYSETIDYLAVKSTTLLLERFPNEKVNEVDLDNKLKDILTKKMTREVIKEKFGLKGSEYDLHQFSIDITPVGDEKFAFNIDTNEIIPNTNKAISISRSFSAE